MLLTSWIPAFRHSLLRRRRPRRGQSWSSMSQLSGFGERMRLTEALEPRMLLTAFVVDQQFVDSHPGTINIVNTTLDINSDGNPEFDSVVIDTALFSGTAGRGVNINLSNLTLNQIAVHSLTINGTASTGLDINLNNVNLKALSIENSKIDGGVDINLIDVQLPELTIAQTRVQGPLGAGLTIDLNSVTRNATVGQLDISESSADGIAITAAGILKPVFNARTSLRSLLSNVVSAGTGTLVVSNGSQFDINDRIRIDSEEMRVSTINGNVITVLRAQNGTTAATHSGGSEIRSVPDLIELTVVDYGLQPGTDVTVTGVKGITAANNKTTISEVFELNPVTGLDEASEDRLLLAGTSGQTGAYLGGGTLTVYSEFGSVRIADNTIAGGTGSDGLAVKLTDARANDFTIEDNVEIDSIAIDLTRTPIDGLTIHNNQRIDAERPQIDAILFDLKESTLTNLIIDANRIQRTIASGGEGVVFDVQDSNVYGSFTNNTVDNTLGHAVQFLASATSAFQLTNRGPLEIDFSSNTAETTLTAPLKSTDTAVQVVDGRAFRTEQIILVQNEQMYITAISGNTLTVQRGARGTLAVSHTTGDRLRSVTSSAVGDRQNISGNTFTRNTGAGIFADLTTGTTLTAEIVSNSFQLNRGGGIDITATDTRAVSTTLQRGGISRTSSLLKVNDASVFSNFLVPFDVMIEGERLTVTGINGNDLTVLRGVGGTTASFHDTNTEVYSASGDGLNLTIGGDTEASGNTFDRNTVPNNSTTSASKGAVAVVLQDDAAGTVSIQNNVIVSTIDAAFTGGANTQSEGDGISISLVGTQVFEEANAVLRRSFIDNNLIGTREVAQTVADITAAATVIGVDNASIFRVGERVRLGTEEITINAINPVTNTLTVTRNVGVLINSIAIPHPAQAYLIPVDGINDGVNPIVVANNRGRGVDIYFEEFTTIQDLQVTRNIIANNENDGVRVRREDDGQTRTVNPVTGQTRAITIAQNIITGNAANPTLEALTPASSEEFGAGIEIVAAFGTIDQLDVEISDNVITRNDNFLTTFAQNSSGIELRAEADAQIHADILRNDISFQDGDGIRFTTREESPTDRRDIGGRILSNRISDNLGSGINLAGHFGIANLVVIGQEGTDEFGASLGNLIERSGDHGVHIVEGGNVAITNNQINFSGTTGAGANPAINDPNFAIGDPTPDELGLDINGSGIYYNAFATRFTTQDTIELVIDGNTISNSAAAGIDINSRETDPDTYTTIRNNLITRNQFDGIELSGALHATILGNFVDQNVGRGLDILIFGTPDRGQAGGTVNTYSRANYLIGNGLESGRNVFVGNGQEGIYYVSSAGSQDQNVLSTNPLSMNQDVGVGQSDPVATLQINTNAISDNGVNSLLSSSGLVLRIGSAGSIHAGGRFYPENQLVGAETGVGAPYDNTTTLDVLGNPGSGQINQDYGFTANAGGSIAARTNANIVGNSFSGNFGDDVQIVPFVSAIFRNGGTPAQDEYAHTEGAWWDTADTPIGPYVITNYFSDPLSRLNLVFEGNSGEGLNVAPDILEAYTNLDRTFKSRDNANSTEANQLDGTDGSAFGPFAGGRARSITQIPSRVGAGIGPFAVLFGSIIPIVSVSPTQPTVDIVNVRDGLLAIDGTTDLIVTTATAHGYSNGDTIQISGVQARTDGNAAFFQHTANGLYEIDVLSLSEFALRGTAGHSGPAYDSGGIASSQDPGSYQYSGVGPSTFRIANGYDESGVGAQNEFDGGDNFDDGILTHPWETWTPLPGLNGIVIDVQQVGFFTTRITSPNHGLTSHRAIRLDGIAGSELANRTFANVTVVDENTFDIVGQLDDAFFQGGEWVTVDDSFLAPYSPTFPLTDVENVTPDPRDASTGIVTINFTEPVTLLDTNDLRLTRDGVPVDISALPVQQVTPTQFTIDISAVTEIEGQYRLTIDHTYPEATFVEPPAVSLLGPIGVVTLNFTENVTGVDIRDFVLTRNANDGQGALPINLTDIKSSIFDTTDNVISTTLTLTISAVDTTVTVNDASQFPTAPGFDLRVDQEEMRVTAVTGNAFTVARGINGTVAAAHTVGAAVASPGFGESLAVTQISPSQYTIDLTSVTDEVGQYRLSLLAPRADSTDTPVTRPNVVGSPVVLRSSAPHGLSDGQLVFIDEMIGNHALNAVGGAISLNQQTYQITIIDEYEFQLVGTRSNGAVPNTGIWRYDAGIVDETGRPFGLDLFGVVADATIVWSRANTAPTGNIIDVTPDPRNTSVAEITVQFSEPVRSSLVNASDFRLTRDVGFGPVPVTLGGSNTPVAVAPDANGFASTYIIPNLTALTNAAGKYRLTLITTDSSRIVDRSGSLLAFPDFDEWVRVDSGPAPVIVNVFPDPRQVPTTTIAVQFNEGVQNVDLGNAGTHFRLTLDTGNGTGPVEVPLVDTLGLPIAIQQLTTTQFEIDLSSVTTLSNGNSRDGRYALTLRHDTPVGTRILASSDGEELAVSVVDSWLQDSTAPTANILDVDPAPRSTHAGVITVEFSEPVTGVDLGSAATDFRLLLDIGDGNGAQQVSLVNRAVRPLSPVDEFGNPVENPFTPGTFSDRYVIDISDITTTPGDYSLSIVSTGSITDFTGNTLVTGATTVTQTVRDATFTAVLTAEINQSQTMFGVSNGALFPSTPGFTVRVGQEEMLVVSRFGNTFTVTRGVNGTTAVTHSIGSDVIDLATVTVVIDSASLLSAIDDVSTSVIVNDVNRFPSRPGFTIRLDREDMLVTGISGSTLTVERAANGTTAAAHEFGAAVVNADIYPSTPGYGIIIETERMTVLDVTGNVLTVERGIRGTTSRPHQVGAIVERDNASDAWHLLRREADSPVIDATNPRNVVVVNPRLPDPSFVSSVQVRPNPAVGDEIDSFFVDLTPPRVVDGSVRIVPNLRSTAVGVVTIDFTEPVTGFNLSDLVLIRDGANVPLNGLTLQQVTPSRYTIDLNLKTGAPGSYALAIQGTGSLIQDLAGNDIQTGLITLDTWTVQNVGPAATVSVDPAFRNTVTEDDPLFVTFTKEVTQVDAGDFLLERDTGSGYVVIGDLGGASSRIGAVSALDQAISTSAAFLVVDDGSLFPTTGGFRIRVDSEEMDVISVTGNRIDVTRGVNGTSATTHAQGVAVSLIRVNATTTSISVLNASDFPTAVPFRIQIGSETATVTAVSGNVFTVQRGTNGTTAAVHLSTESAVLAQASVTSVVTSELAAGISTVATTIPVLDGSVFPSVGGYSIRIDRELMTVVSVSGNMLTVTRGASGTAIVAHAAGAQVSAVSSTSLVGTVSDTATTVTVADARFFPSTPGFGIVIDSEQLTVTAISGNSFTVTRAARATTAVAHLTGSTVLPAFSQTFKLDLTTTGLIDLQEASYRLTVVASNSHIVDRAGIEFANSASATWVLDRTAPTANIVDVIPDPVLLNGEFPSAGIVNILFNEPVQNVDISDFELLLGGVPVAGFDSLAVVPEPSATGAASRRFTIDLTSVTTVTGNYELRLLASNILDLAGNALGSSATFTDDEGRLLTLAGGTAGVAAADQFYAGADTIQPTVLSVQLANGSTIPSVVNNSVGVLTVTFSEDVQNVDVDDFVLTRGGAAVTLPANAVSLKQGSKSQYLLDLSTATAISGTYRLEVRTNGASGAITDLNDLPLASSVATNVTSRTDWTFTVGRPSATISMVTPDPRLRPAGVVSISFEDGKSTLSGAITNTATTLTVADATQFPTTPGFVVYIDSETLRVNGIAGNTLNVTRGFNGTVAAAHTSGTAVIAPADVSGVDISDFRLTRIPAGSLVAQPVSLQSISVTQSPVGASQYLIDLTSVTGAEGTYTLTLVANGSGIVALGSLNPLRTDAVESWTTFTTINLRNPLSNPLITLSFSDRADANTTDKRIDTDLGVSGEQRTLRAAVQESNALAGDDVIDLAAGTYTLSIGGTDDTAVGGDLDITDTTGSLTIRGLGVDQTFIDAGSLFRVFHVLQGAELILENLTVRNGRVTGSEDGGGIQNSNGTVTLSNVRVTGNVSADDGGAINNAGTMTVINSTIDNNTAAASGAGIRNAGLLTIISSTIGGVFDQTDPANVIDDRNVAGLNGGGLTNIGNGTAMIVGSTFSGNIATTGTGGAIFNGATVNTALATTLAIDLAANAGSNQVVIADPTKLPSAGTFVIRIGAEDMLVTGINGSTFTVTRGFNGTVIAAHLTDDPLSLQSNLGLVNVTIADNTAGTRGGGLAMSTGTTIVTNTIIARNMTPGTVSPDVSNTGTAAALRSGGNNIVTNVAGAGGALGVSVPLPVSQLGVLGANGGPTLTQPLLIDPLAANPAINGGRVVSDATDQRGVSRNLGNGTPDIGAYEFGGFFVDSTADSIDTLPGDGRPEDYLGRATLRAAVMEANALAGSSQSLVNEIVLGDQRYLLDITAIDRTNPTVNIVDVQDPLAAAPTVMGAIAQDPINEITIDFSEPIRGIVLDDPLNPYNPNNNFRLLYDDGTGPVLVPFPLATTILTQPDPLNNPTQYVLTGLEKLLAADGQYTFQVLTAGISDYALTPNWLAPETLNNIAIAATDVFLRGDDIFAPTAALDPIVTPRQTNPGVITLRFNESVIGVDTSNAPPTNFTLTYDPDAGGPLPAQQIALVNQIVTGSGAEYTLDLSAVQVPDPITMDPTFLTLPGRYTLAFNGQATAIQDLFQNTFTAAVPPLVWDVVDDTFAPVADIVDIVDDPRIGHVSDRVTINFNEEVTGLDLTNAGTDFTLTRDVDGPNGPMLPVNVPLVDANGSPITLQMGANASTYSLDLSSVTMSDGYYVLTLTTNSMMIQDLAENDFVTPVQDVWVIGDDVTETFEGQTTLTANIDNVVTVFNVEDITLLQVQAPFVIQIGTEQMQVTAINVTPNTPGQAPVPDTITVVRGFNGTMITPHAAGTVVWEVLSFNPGAFGDLDVTAGDLTIVGTSVGQSSVNANQIDRVLDVRGGAQLTLRSTTISGGNVEGDKDGGGVRAIGSLTLDRTTISDNVAGNRGGGIYSEGVPSDDTVAGVLVPVSILAGQTTLVANITAAATSFDVTNAAVFPSLLPFVIQIGAEQMIVTGVAGNTLTVTRAANGTAAAVANAGAATVQVYTAATTVLSVNNVASLPNQSVFTIRVGTEEMLVTAISQNDLRVTRAINGTIAGVPTLGVAVLYVFDATTDLVPVNNPAVFPTNPGFEIQIGAELMLVTAITGNTFRVVRGFKSTNAVPHVLGEPVIFSAGMQITSSAINSNTADFGGGVYNNSPGFVNVIESTFASNSALTDGGGIYNDRSAAIALNGSSLVANTAGRDGGGFYNNDSASVSFTDSSLTSNVATGDGGGLFNELIATATFTNSTVSFNRADNGGGIFDQDGTVTVAQSAFSANSAVTDGGAVFVTSSATFNSSNTTYSGNRAQEDGGAFMTHGTTTLDNVRVVDNVADVHGGGLANTRFLTLQSVVLSGNHSGSSSSIGSGGGLYSSANGNVTISLTDILSNSTNGDGGGIYNTDTSVIAISASTIADSSAGSNGGGLYQGSTGTVTFANSTVARNVAVNGGGLYSTGTVDFTNSTLSTNTASASGGGLANNGGNVSFSSATVYDNSAAVSGGGVLNVSAFGPVFVRNTIIAHNAAASDPDVTGVAFQSLGNNLIGDAGSVSAAFIDGINGDLAGAVGLEIDPLLGPLQDNGGPTETHALLFGSPARDAGSNVGVPATDQRGFARIFDGDGDGLATVDVGAFESGFVVNTFTDTVDVNPGDQASADEDGNSSLRAAVMEANALAGDDTILLIPGTYTLTIAGRDEDGALTGDLDVTDNLTIIGSGSDQTFIDGAMIDRIFHVLPGARLDLKDLTILGGSAVLGGGILNQGFVTTENVVIRDNVADFGAGILNDLIRTTLPAGINGTQTSLTVADPALFPTKGSFDIRIGSEEVRVTAVDATGVFTVVRGVNGTTAAVHALGASVTLVQSMTLTNTTISNNAARLRGGGIYNRNELSLDHVIVSGNTSNSQGGGLFNQSAVAAFVSIVDSTFDSNVAAVSGGAIYNNGIGGGETSGIAISSSTLSYNRAGVQGGGIYNNDVITILNATFSGNAAGSNGGAIYNTPHLDATVGTVGQIFVTNATFTRNLSDGVAGGIANKTGARVELKNSIVAGNDAVGSDNDIAGAIMSLGNNFIGDGGNSTGLISGINFDLVGSATSPFDPVLGPLADNGGPTLTHALQPGSPAIDAGNNSGGEPVDQRGGRRPTDNTADIGAFEVQFNMLSINDVVQVEGGSAATATDHVGSTFYTFTVALAAAATEPISVQYDVVAKHPEQGETLATSITATSTTVRLNSAFTFTPSGSFQIQIGSEKLTVTSVAGTTLTVTRGVSGTVATSHGAGELVTVITNNVLGSTIGSADTLITVTDLLLFPPNPALAGNKNFDIQIGHERLTVTAISGTTLTVRRGVGGTVAAAHAAGVRVTPIIFSDARAGEDFQATSGTLTFAPGQLTRTITVEVFGDATPEDEERFTVRLLNPVNAVVVDSEGVGAIQNDDARVSVSSVAAPESDIPGGQTLTFTVTLSRQIVTEATVHYATADSVTSNGADAGSDYVGLTNALLQTLTFAPGETQQTFTVTINGDIVSEQDEIFYVNLSDAKDANDNPLTLHIAQGTGTIQNDDSAFDIQVKAGIDKTEGTGTDKIQTVVVSLLNANAFDVTVDLIPMDGTGASGAIRGATNGTDFDLDPANRHVVIPAGTTSVEVPVTIIGDALFEGGAATFEDFIIAFDTNSATRNGVPDSNAGFAGAAVGQIFDNELPPTEWRIVRNGGSVEIYRDGVFNTSFVENGSDIVVPQDPGAKDDRFTVDFSGGNPLPSGSGRLLIDGMLQDAGDSLVITNTTGTTSVTSVVYNATGQHSGTILINDGTSTGTISYTGLEPVTDELTAVDRTFAIDASYVFNANPSIRVSAAGQDTIIDGRNASGTPLFEAVTFKNPTGSLTLNAGGGNNTITIQPLAASFNPTNGFTINAGAGDDTVIATGVTRGLIINGGDGVDSITGGNGNDTIDGGIGNDTLLGGAGNDSITGNLDNDSLDGGAGDDTLLGSTGNDTIRGGADNDVVDGEVGNDSVFGDAGNDVVHGSAGNDTLDGGIGNDVIDGGVDNDSLLGGDGNDTVVGGDGDDIADGGKGLDSVTGGLGNDTLTGGDDVDFVDGEAGSDSVTGGLGNDSVFGGEGNDTVAGGGGIDTLNGGNGIDRINETSIGTGDIFLTDTRLTVSGNDVAFTSIEEFQLTGNAFANKIDASGFSGDVTIFGGSGNDTLIGGSGNDFLSGDLGNDSIEGNAGNDVIFGGGGNDVANGGTGDDYVGGNSGNDVLSGNDGDDRVFGQQGSDTVHGDAGVDNVRGGAGNDLVFGDTENDRLDGDEPGLSIGESGNDTVYGGVGDDVVIGNFGDDLIVGGAGNDLLQGGSGRDTLISGEGNDQADAGGSSGDVLYLNFLNLDGNDNFLFQKAGSRIFVSRDNDSSGSARFKDAERVYLSTGAGNDVVTVREPGTSATSIVFDINLGIGDDRMDASGILNPILRFVVAAGAGNDTLLGGPGADFMAGDDGDDVITNLGGQNTLRGNAGNDTITSGSGNDSIDAGDGADIVTSGAGNDVIVGGTGIDSILGGEGNDTISGDDGADTLRGEAGTDSLSGGNDSDKISGGDGADTIYGDDGADTIRGDASDDFIDGGDAADLIDGGRGNDTISGNSGDDTLLGSDDNDNLRGAGGRDIVIGGLGADEIRGQGTINDTLVGNNGGDSPDPGDTFPEDLASEIDNAFVLSSGVLDRLNF